MKTSGWNEWADKRVSLYRGCTNGCKYCFARANALRFGQIRTAGEWARPVLNQKEAARKWGRCKGIVAAFGTHDITEANMIACCSFLRGLLEAGNRVLIVTKPVYAAVDYLCCALFAFAPQVEWRFTITAQDDALLKYWEPDAPCFAMRLHSLRTTTLRGWHTSVSIEPMLDSANVVNLVRELWPFVSKEGGIWIGKMNHVRTRVRIVTNEDRKQVERIEAGQTDQKIMEIVKALDGHPLVRWKDSIREVMERNSGTAT